MNSLNKLASAFILVTMMMGPYSHAAEVSLPVISSPVILSEGTQTFLSKDQIAELTPWATDSKASLQELLDNLEEKSSADKIELITTEFETILSNSAHKRSELFMRYSLTRALALIQMIKNETGSEVVGGNDLQLRILVSSAKMAIKYYDADMTFLNKKQQSSFAIFGVEYFNFLTYLNKSVIDSSVQYAIQKTSLEWLQWDLYRDLDNTKYAGDIVRINSFLTSLPSGKVSDKDALNLIKQMKKLATKLDVLTASKNEAEETLALKTQLRVEQDTYGGYEENGKTVPAILGAGSLVEVVDKEKFQIYDYHVEVRVISSAKIEAKSTPVGAIVKVPYMNLKPAFNSNSNSTAFGQTYTALYNGLIVKSNCGTVKKFGYRDVAFVGAGSTIQVLDAKPIRYTSHLFIIMDPNFVKVKILNARIGVPGQDAPTGCVGYVSVSELRRDIF